MTSRTMRWMLGVCCVLVALLSVSASMASPVAVSLLQLLNDPKRYEGLEVEVVGYLNAGANLRIYLTKDLAEVSDALSSILVSDTDEGGISSSSCIASFVRIRGTFTEMDPHSFGLTHVERIYQPSTQRACWTTGE